MPPLQGSTRSPLKRPNPGRPIIHGHHRSLLCPRCDRSEPMQRGQPPERESHLLKVTQQAKQWRAGQGRRKWGVKPERGVGFSQCGRGGPGWAGRCLEWRPAKKADLWWPTLLLQPLSYEASLKDGCACPLPKGSSPLGPAWSPACALSVWGIRAPFCGHRSSLSGYAVSP